MPWTSDRYPPSMRKLSPLVREKAIAIANAMLEEGYPEGHAIRMAIAAAKRWAARAWLADDALRTSGVLGWRLGRPARRRTLRRRKGA